MGKNAKGLCLATSTLAATILGLTSTTPTWALTGGNVKIETDNAIYNKGDDVTLEIKIKADDGSDFLLQSDIKWSNGMTLKSVSGDNIQYNRGKIVGTAPKSEFVINVTLNIHAEEDQSIQLVNIKMGSVDGSPNYTIDKSEKVIDIKEPVKEEPSAPTEPPETLPPVTEPPAPSEPEQPKEPETPYSPWKATVTVGDSLNVREGPGLNYNIIGKLNDGDHVVVTNEQQGGDIVWLKVEKGWISKDYVVKGHIEKPEKTDEEIEKEQQEQIKNEAQTAEKENQSNNQEAQKKDEDKKQEYDQQEQQQEITNSQETEEIKNSEEETPPTEETTGSSVSENPSPSLVNPISSISGSSYARYQTNSMTKPFYLYLESYSLQFPEDFEKTALTIGSLDFLMAVPKDIGLRQANVYLTYGNYDINKEPALYYFDQDTNSFFPYDKMIEKTIVVDNTVEYVRKPINKSSILLALAGVVAVYAAGIITTCLRYRQKEKNQPAPATTKSKIKKPTPEKEIKDMDDEELDYILRYYGASTEDMIKKEKQKAGDSNKAPHVPTANSQNPANKPDTQTGETKGKEMQWDTLAHLIENPEEIEEQTLETNSEAGGSTTNISNTPEKKNKSTISTEVVPELKIDLKFEAEPDTKVVIDDLQAAFEQNSQKDNLGKTKTKSHTKK